MAHRAPEWNSDMTKLTSSDYAATLLRVSSGALFLAHGLLKVNVFRFLGVSRSLTSSVSITPVTPWVESVL